MDYKEFINYELAENLDNIFKKMNDMNIINKNEVKYNLKVLEELREEMKNNNQPKKKSDKKKK
ncbi:MAG: hypothetical protein ACQESP_00080 [Candidatus Muiribacteriota bacterium]